MYLYPPTSSHIPQIGGRKWLDICSPGAEACVHSRAVDLKTIHHLDTAADEPRRAPFVTLHTLEADKGNAKKFLRVQRRKRIPWQVASFKGLAARDVCPGLCPAAQARKSCHGAAGFCAPLLRSGLGWRGSWSWLAWRAGGFTGREQGTSTKSYCKAVGCWWVLIPSRLALCDMRGWISSTRMSSSSPEFHSTLRTWPKWHKAARPEKVTKCQTCQTYLRLMLSSIRS